MFTSRSVYEHILKELRKNHAPSFYLEDYVYFINKAVNRFVSEEYKQFETTQQKTDMLSSISTTAKFVVNHATGTVTVTVKGENPFERDFAYDFRYGSRCIFFRVPRTYRHFLGANLQIKNSRPYSCYGTNYVHNNPTAKLTSDIGNGIMNNDFLKPMPHRPYHSFTDTTSTGDTPEDTLPDIFFYYGSNAAFKIMSGELDFVKQPNVVRLTEAQVDAVVDSSDKIDFTNQAVYKIIDICVSLILENRGNPRLQSQVAVSKEQ